MHGPASSSEPYVSFITFSRNDDYAGGLDRLLWSTAYLAQQCDEFCLPAECVLVQWNPPGDRESLSRALGKLPDSRYLSIRVITVPAARHRRYKFHHLRPVHGGAAANVGLRRARGTFLVIKVADAFYSDALIRRLAKRDLDSRHLYRAVRVDVAPQLAQALGEPRADFLGLCAEHVVHRNDHLPQPWMPFSLPDLFTNASGDFQLLSRTRWHDLRGYWETSDVTAFETDSMFAYAAHAARVMEARLPPDCVVYKISHSASHGHRVTSASDWWTRKMLQVERLLSGLGHSQFTRFALRAIFNYPPKIYSGLRKPVYERSLIRFKLLSLFPSLTRLKSKHWGLARESLVETQLRRAVWETTSS